LRAAFSAFPSSGSGSASRDGRGSERSGALSASSRLSASLDANRLGIWVAVASVMRLLIAARADVLLRGQEIPPGGLPAVVVVELDAVR
jgi:hypothetical protein